MSPANRGAGLAQGAIRHLDGFRRIVLTLIRPTGLGMSFNDTNRAFRIARHVFTVRKFHICICWFSDSPP
jgi:hypothetical protein